MNALDSFYFKQPSPQQEILLALKTIILSEDPHITNELKYGMPFFCYKGKMFCYLWTNKKTGQPYIGIVEGKHFNQPFLVQEKRSRMKIMALNPEEDLPIEIIRAIIQQAIDLYKQGVVKIK